MSKESARFRRRRLDAARGYLMLGMPESARRELKKIRQNESCLFDCLLLEAETFREMTSFDEAISLFEEALQHEPGHLQALLGLAWCYKRIDRIHRAIDSLEMAKQHHPEESIVIYNLACYYTLLGDKPKAIECLGRSLRMEPQLRQLIDEETDFDGLRSDPDFQFVTNP